MGVKFALALEIRNIEGAWKEVAEENIRTSAEVSNILYNKLHNLYPSLNTVSMVKSKRIRWAEYVACMMKLSGEREIVVTKSKWKGCMGSLI
jgi:hypothetical protein